MDSARRAVEDEPAEPVPMALRNAPTKLMREQGYGQGYVYAHDSPDGVGGIECLPTSLRGARFYLPKDRGFEGQLARRLASFRSLQERARETASPIREREKPRSQDS